MYPNILNITGNAILWRDIKSFFIIIMQTPNLLNKHLILL